MLNPTHKRQWAAFAATALFLFLFSLPAVAKEGKRGWLGITCRDIDSEMAQERNLKSRDGVLIEKVRPESPAAEAGLREGDIIIEFAGQKILDDKALTKAVRRAAPGRKIAVRVLRDGKKKKFDVVLGERPGKSWSFGNGQGKKIKITSWKRDRGFLGVELDNLNDQMGDYFEVKDGKGALIAKVIQDSAADKAGLKAGDVIVRMDDQDIASSNDVHSVLADTKPEDRIRIQVIRKGKTKKIDLTLGSLPEDLGFGNIEFFGDDGRFPTPSSQGFSHGDGHFPHIGREITISDSDREELEELKDELEELKEELQKLKDELKK
ncbi:hypothetical protein CSA17_05215 [bacterium DOLJORAL78_65_58]|nr:MAG: hypothetical protein CSB20_08230 [bacterium DOLZORAL124_64_63]PIE75868.1 MAG: hypothetical protein CSA17_05215 [bacterium DOLJORAL78_65_58]